MERNAVIIIRMHPFVTEPLGIPAAFRDRLIDGSDAAVDVNDLLHTATRDFSVPFETFVPGRIVRTFPEMLDAIRRDDYEVEKVAPFAARHFVDLDGGSTDRVIDDLIHAP